MLNRIFILLFLVGSSFTAIAQHQEHTDKNLRSFFERGEFELHARSIFMSTFNKDELTDFSSLGLGAGIGYRTPYYKNFRIGISGFFIFQLYDHNLVDESGAGMGSRYELTLYDMHDPENKQDLDRLEELFIEYKRIGFGITLGRQKVHSPFLNEQDNRMRPNLFSGLMAKYERGKMQLEGGWLSGVSPRGTINWYSIEDSYGVYPFGRNVYGEASGYQGNISSKGIGLLGLKYNSSTGRLQAWNYYADNVFNLSFVQADQQFSLGEQRLLLGAQGFYQTAINQGGNHDPSKSYIQPRDDAFGLSLRTGVRKGAHQLTLNYLGISKNGRFLFPREWGREVFYASLPRERYEGSGGTNAYTLKYDYAIPGKNITAMAGVGRVDFPEVHNYKLNKYELPSYYHIAGRIDYRPKGFMEGMDIMLQAVHKIAQEPSHLTPRDFLNKVDMWNLTLMVDYRF
jgi:hypothetical protein